MMYANYASVQKNSPNGAKNKSAKQQKRRANQRNTSAGKTEDATQELLNYKNKLGAALTQIYPLIKEQTHPAEPEWVTKLEKWGTKQAICQLDNDYKKRAELQEEISRRNKKLRRQGNASSPNRSYKRRNKQRNTPRNMPPRSNMPDAT